MRATIRPTMRPTIRASTRPSMRPSIRPATGSILIWTVTLGLALTTSFFFLGLRLGLARDTQRGGTLYQSQKAYLESYVDYKIREIQNRIQQSQAGGGPPDPTPGSTENINFDGISGQVVQEDSIKGKIEPGNSVTLDLSGSGVGIVTVHWNKCANPTVSNIQLVADGTPENVPNGSGSQCAVQNPPVYGDSYPLVTTPTPNNLIITALNGPLEYEVSHDSTGKFRDAKWKITAYIGLPLGKRIKVDKVVP